MWLISLLFWIAAYASGDADAPEASVGNEDNPVWHLLSRDVQHRLSGALSRYGGAGLEEDGNVSIVLSNLLHDELVDEEKVQQQLLAKEEAEQQELSRKLEEEERAAEEQRRSKREAELKALEAERDAHHAKLEAERKVHEAAHQEELARAQAENEARQRAHDEFMSQMRVRHDKAEERHAALKKQHEERWARTSSLLQQVHAGLEEVTAGWRDAPFWDDFFRNTSTAASWSHLRLDHLRPALNEVPVRQDHHVLVLEPSGAGLAGRLADSLRGDAVQHTEALTYGTEVIQGSSGHDLVVEVGLLDAMALANGDSNGADASKLSALQKAAAHLASLVKPGGTWMSISVVPPALRVPLLGRLAGKRFAVPSETEDAKSGTHTIVLREEPPSGSKATRSPGLRGAAQVADMLLYGSEDAHVWAYRLRRGEAEIDGRSAEGAPTEADGLLDMIRQQRPWTRDDL